MSPARLQLKGASLQELRAQVLAEYGPAARIVAAEKVTVGGIRGYLARQHYEVTVELPDQAQSGASAGASGLPRRGAHALDRPRRAGIAALLAEAEALEAKLHGQPPEVSVSTSSGDFAELMDDLTFNTGQTPKAPGPAAGETAPVPLAGPGDLVVVAGLGEDPLLVARSMAAVIRGPVPPGQDSTLPLAPEVKAGGALAGTVRRPVQDRKSALAARARGVERGHSVFVAFGLGRGGPDLAGFLPVLAGLEADQVWVAVDAGRKQEDTARWVGQLRETAVVDAVAVEGLACTSTPGTVLELGLPIGWIDGARS